jgi:hypothetical protein
MHIRMYDHAVLPVYDHKKNNFAEFQWFRTARDGTKRNRKKLRKAVILGKLVEIDIQFEEIPPPLPPSIF